MKIKTGSLLDVTEGVIVHGCNCQGVMGSGVALAIKNKWPAVFSAYRRLYEKKGLFLGDILTVKSPDMPEGLHVINGMTQETFGRDGKQYVDYDAVSQVFKRVAAYAKNKKLSIHYPKIGCGLGGGDWNIVSARIDKALAGLDHTLWIPE